MFNSLKYSNATSVDLSKYTESTVSYYNPPIVDKFVCPQSNGLSKEEKVKAIDNYITNVNRFFGQLSHNLRAAKKEGDTQIEQAYRRHYNYHIAQRSLAQKCKSLVRYGGNTSTVGTFAFPKPEPVKEPEKKPPIETQIPKSKPIKQPSFCDVNPNSPKCKGGINLDSEQKAPKKKSSVINKDILLGLLGGVVLYLVVLK